MAATPPIPTVRFGVHTGLQHTSMPELIELWRQIEDLGFDWISIWDHFYAADATGDPHCLEAVAAHATLAATTERVRCGSLVYSAGYRHPAVLANATASPREAAPSLARMFDTCTLAVLVLINNARPISPLDRPSSSSPSTSASRAVRADVAGEEVCRGAR